jgi:hypothetical protein
MSQRTGGLTALCVLALVAGALGLLSGLSGVLNLLAGEKLQRAILQVQPAANPGMQDAQKVMQEELAAVMMRYRTFHWVQAACQLLLSTMMISGAILALLLKPAGRSLLLTSLIVALLFVPVQSTLGGLMLQKSGPIMEKSMERMAKQAAPPGARQPPGLNEMMGALGRVMVIMQWIMLVGLALVKCIFYLFGVWYLTRPAVAELFARRAGSPSVELTSR